MFKGVEYGPLMYKTILRLATIGSIATTETLRANLNNIPSYAASVNGDVDLINFYLDTNYTQILARGATVNDPIAKLFDAYLSVPDYNFKQYISTKQDDYHDGNLGINFTHKNLMAQATAKFTYLTVCQVRGAKSPDKKKLIAMIADLKGKLKLDPNLEKKKKKKKKKKKDNKAKDKDEERSPKGGDNKKKKNKKDTSSQQEESKEGRGLKEGTPIGKQGQREDSQGEDLSLVHASHGLGHQSSQGLLPCTLKEGCPEGPSADDSRCFCCNHCKPLLHCLPLQAVQ
jgi:hypothetical protein